MTIGSIIMARNQSFQQIPRKRFQQVHYQPRTIRPEAIFDNYLDIYNGYLDMVHPTPVVRSTPVYLDEYVEHNQVILSIVQNSLHHRAPVRTAIEPLGEGPLIVGTETEILK